MLSNSGLPNTHSLSAQCRYCSVTAVQWGVASVCRLHYILQTGLFHQFPLLLLTHLTQRACAPGQDSGHCAQLSFRVASESAGCDSHLARVIIRLSYMGIIRLAVILSFLSTFKSNWWQYFGLYEDCLMIGHL